MTYPIFEHCPRRVCAIVKKTIQTKRNNSSCISRCHLHGCYYFVCFTLRARIFWFCEYMLEANAVERYSITISYCFLYSNKQIQLIEYANLKHLFRKLKLMHKSLFPFNYRANYFQIIFQQISKGKMWNVTFFENIFCLQVASFVLIKKIVSLTSSRYKYI